MIIPVTITDLTQMGGQRVCLAGYLPDSTCVRPMFQSDSLNKNWLREGKKAIIRPFSVVEFDFKNERTISPPHTEDRYILPNHRLNCGMLNYDQQKAFLQKIDDVKVSSIFGAEIHTDLGWYVRAGEGERSLGTINAPKIEGIIYRPLSSGWDYRIIFTDRGGDRYRLAVTDLTFRYFLDHLYFREGISPSEASRHLKEKLQKSQLFFRIGLSRNWDKYPNRCFLQINGVFSFPDYLEGRNFLELELPGDLLTKRNKIASNIDSHEVQMSKSIHDIYENLKKYFGYSSFRYPQEEIIRDILAGRDVFVLMPTAGGKSLCYQLPATIFNGLTVVVSPLVSLMKDQVDYLNRIGIVAFRLKSGQSSEEKDKIWKKLHLYDAGIIYVSPERITQASFLRKLNEFNVSLFAIDEAHCICEWGPQFRPEYRELSILKDFYPETPMIALTATATPDEVKDIIKQLHLSNAKEYIKSFNRENLTYEVRPKQEEYYQLRDYLNNHKNDSGIIYCLSKWKTENLAEKLQDDGFQAKPFHSGIGEKIKNFTQEKFMDDEIRVITATTAFGMGIDKPNVHFVIHYDLPFSIEDYYQQTGRAGRDGKGSECILFYNYEDKQRVLKLIKSDPRFHIGDLKNLQSLIKKLKLDEDPISRYIQGKLSTDSQSFLLSYNDSTSPINLNIKKLILQDLNNLLTSFLYSEKDLFVDVQLPDKIRSRIDRKEALNSDEIKELNRLLLEGAYPQEIAGKDEEERDLDKLNRYEKLDDIIDFCRTNSCRRKFLLNYFGENYNNKNCEACDNCNKIKINLSSDKPSPQSHGSTIQWVAQIKSSENFPVLYRFSLRSLSTRNRWLITTDWTKTNSWIWTPTEMDVGDCQVKADMIYESDSGYEQPRNYAIKEYKILRKKQPPRLINFSPDLKGPQAYHVPITWIAEALDPNREVIYYRFSLRSRSTKNKWLPQTSWTENNKWKWMPLKLDIGDCQIAVEIRRDHTAKDEYDEKRIKNFTIMGSSEGPEVVRQQINSKSDSRADERGLKANRLPIDSKLSSRVDEKGLKANHLRLLHLNPDNYSPQPASTSINWNAVASDPYGNVLYYKFWLKAPNQDSWEDMTGWITQSNWTWRTNSSHIGHNKIKIQIRDGHHAGSEDFDKELIVGYTIIEET